MKSRRDRVIPVKSRVTKCQYCGVEFCYLFTTKERLTCDGCLLENERAAQKRRHEKVKSQPKLQVAATQHRKLIPYAGFDPVESPGTRAWFYSR